MTNIEKLLASAPDNFVIRDALVKCVEVVEGHNSICCAVSGGADSDVMLDMLLRCGAGDKTTFVFYDTGLEYAATKEHLTDIEKPYEVLINRYPACQTALRWWCNAKSGQTTQFYIERNPMLKEFIVQRPPDFKIGNMCCQYAKKAPSHDFIKGKNFDLLCLGIRLAEGGEGRHIQDLFYRERRCGRHVPPHILVAR